RQLLGGRAFGQQALQFLVDDRLDLLLVDALLDHGVDEEAAAELRRPVGGADAVHQLVLVHQALVQARSGAAAEHLREQVEHGGLGAAVLGHVPDAAHHHLRDLVLEHGAAGLGQRRDRHVRLLHGRAGRDVAEVLRDLLLRGLQVDVAGQHQHRVVRAVPGAEPLLHVLERGRVEVVHRADGGVVVRVPFGVHGLGDHLAELAVGLVLALALLVLDHAALFVEHLLVDRAEQVAHAVGFHPQRHVQRGGRHVLEVVGAVGVGGAVHVGRAGLLERLEVLARVVLGTVEHQVLEQVREAAAPGRLVLAAHAVPDVDRHDRGLVVLVHDHGQAVGQGELLVRDADDRGRAVGVRRRQVEGGPERGGQGERQRSGAQQAGGTGGTGGREGHAALLCKVGDRPWRTDGIAPILPSRPCRGVAQTSCILGPWTGSGTAWSPARTAGSGSSSRASCSTAAPAWSPPRASRGGPPRSTHWPETTPDACACCRSTWPGPPRSPRWRGNCRSPATRRPSTCWSTAPACCTRASASGSSTRPCWKTASGSTRWARCCSPRRWRRCWRTAPKWPTSAPSSARSRRWDASERPATTSARPRRTWSPHCWPRRSPGAASWCSRCIRAGHAPTWAARTPPCRWPTRWPACCAWWPPRAPATAAASATGRAKRCPGRAAPTERRADRKSVG